MAAADYYLCDRCDSKVFYDANVDYRTNTAIKALCSDCATTHVIIIQERP